jgi:hypothetical protein
MAKEIKIGKAMDKKIAKITKLKLAQFSTSNTCALQAAIALKGWKGALSQWADGKFQFSFENKDGKTRKANADTPAEAICRAIIKTTEK